MGNEIYFCFLVQRLVAKRARADVDELFELVRLCVVTLSIVCTLAQ